MTGVATVDALTPAACDEVVAALDPTGWQPATVAPSSGRPADVDPTLRAADVQVVPRHVAARLGRLWEALVAVNDGYFRFDVDGVLPGDPPTVVRYRPASGEDLAGHYGSHLDLGPATPWRKISFTVQLSPADAYEGGELHFDHRNLTASRVRGNATVFPSYLGHRVTPVTGGERLALVGWLAGPPLR
jgi:PKHD-type hydroxylase